MDSPGAPASTDGTLGTHAPFGTSSGGVHSSSPEWLRSWIAACVDGLARARADIDAMNVFPVPDGDTGTNLYLTMAAAWEALAASLASGAVTLAEATAAVRAGVLHGARGNSGVILAQMLHGATAELAESGGDEAWTSSRLARMLRRASDEGYRAVGKPLEGTILTVARAAAEAAEALEALEAAATDEAGKLAAAGQAVLDAARQALARTPEQLEALRLAGVVDAGGSGLVVVLEGLAASLAGRAPLEPTEQVDWAGEASHAEPVTYTYGGPAFEVMFLLESGPDHLEALRERLLALGDSLVITGADESWNVHVHVDDAGAAVDAALAAGRAHDFRITYLAEHPHAESAAAAARALVAVSHGPGTARIFEGAGAHVVHAQARQRPSTGEFLSAIERCQAGEVIVLPSDSDAQATAQQAAAQARERGLRVAVIPTRSVVQTLSAIAVHDPERPLDSDVAAMSAAAGATRYAAVTVAVKAALTSAGQCAVGDVLGVVDGDIVEIGPDVETVTRRLIDRLLASGGDLVTVVLGAEAPAEVRTGLAPWIRRTHPLSDVVVAEGGQPLWPVILGVE